MNLRRRAIGPTDTLWDLASLLASAGVATVDELSEEVRQNEDVDIELMLTNRGVLLRTSVSGIELVFPFMWQDFWASIKDLEHKYGRRTRLHSATEASWELDEGDGS